MKIKTMNTIAPSAMPGSVLRGALAGIALTILGAVVMSGLIIKETLRETSIGYCAMGILLLASVAASMVSIRHMGSKRIQVSLITGAIYAGVLMLANGLLYKGGFDGVGETLLIIFGGSVAAALLGTGGRNKQHSARRKKKHR